MSLKLKTNEKILFIGDSITDCGRRVAERPYGFGYVKIFRDMLIAREPEKQIGVINKGVDGNTVRDLRDRWSDDVVRFKPDWLSIKIGINDLNFFLMGRDGRYPVATYREIYDEILSQTVNALPATKILLISPFYLSCDTSGVSYRSKVLEVLPDYLAVVDEMSEKYNTLLVRTHEIFQNRLKYYDTDTFCNEPVHPNLTGHQVIAETVYQTLTD